MEQVNVYRRQNLRKYIAENGGPTQVAQTLGYTNSSFLVQMTGPSPIRAVSEKTAREFERKLNIAPGSLDQPTEANVFSTLPRLPDGVPPPAAPAPAPISTEAENIMKMIYSALNDAHVEVTIPKFITLVSQSLMMRDRAGRPIIEDDLRPLIDLVKQ